MRRGLGSPGSPASLWDRRGEGPKGGAIRAPADGRTDWFAGGAVRATRVRAFLVSEGIALAAVGCAPVWRCCMSGRRASLADSPLGPSPLRSRSWLEGVGGRRLCGDTPHDLHGILGSSPVGRTRRCFRGKGARLRLALFLSEADGDVDVPSAGGLTGMASLSGGRRGPVLRTGCADVLVGFRTAPRSGGGRRWIARPEASPFLGAGRGWKGKGRAPFASLSERPCGRRIGRSVGEPAEAGVGPAL